MSIKRYYILSFLLLSYCGLKAQYDNNWTFGWHGGMNFNTNPPTIFESATCNDSNGNYKNQTTGASSSISDCNGNLLFYAAGRQIWNRKHQLMPHGYLNPNSYNSSDTRACMIIPKPLSDSEYYVIMSVDLSPFEELKYSVVNMNLDNGYGDVDTTQMNVKLLSKAISYNFTYVKHANDTDFWLICTPDSNTYAFKVTANGIDKNYVYTSNTVYKAGTYSYVAKSSHDGKNIIIGGPYQGSSSTKMGVFNRKTGKVMSQQTIFPASTSSTSFDVEFSPNDSIIYYYNSDVVYGSTTYYINKLYQIDRFAQLPSKSLVLIDSFILSQQQTKYYGMQVTPDNRIIMGRPNDTMITIIQNPDKLGKECNFQRDIFNISPGRWGAAPPNNYSPMRKLRFVTQLDSTGCSLDSVWFGNVSDTNFKSFKWYFGDGDSSDLANPVHYYTNSGTYRVLLTGYLNTCSYKQFYSDSVYINHKPNVSLIDTAYYTCGQFHVQTKVLYKFSDTLNLHLGNIDTVLYTNNSNLLNTFTYNNVHDTNGTYIYSVLAKNAKCNDSVATKHSVVFEPKVGVYFKPDYSQSCGNSTITLTDSSGGKDSIIQQRKWTIEYPNGIVKKYDTVSTNKIKLIVQDTGYYNAKLVYITKQGCTDSLYKTNLFRILPQPDVYIDSPANNPLCYGDSFTFTAKQKNTGYPPLVTYKWNMGQVTTPSITIDTANTYYVSASNIYGCGATSNKVKIDFLPQLFANIKKSKDSLYVVTNRPVINHTWYKDTVLFGNSSSLFHPPSGRYYVHVVDGNGCVANSGSLLHIGLNHIVQIENLLHVYPNPTNDQLYVDGLPQVKTSIILYDMLGKKVYSAFTNGETLYNTSIEHLPKGIYILSILDERIRIHKE